MLKKLIFLSWMVILVAAALLFMNFDNGRSLAFELSVYGKHPEGMYVGVPVCSDCHAGDTLSGKPVKAFDHDQRWYEIHKYPGAYAAEVCSSCHKQSYCADCHGSEEELKPSLKHADKPGHQMPHRGNYLVQHQVDGKTDPAKCFKCHGRRNNEQCKRCHKNGR